VAARFEELDWAQTPMGEISLRRRHDPVVDAEVYEVKLGDEYLMSSLFTVAEVELSRLALAELAGDQLDVVVGGLGLGHTALTVLEYGRVRSLVVVEALREVIRWHERGLVPLGAALCGDERTQLLHGDFFALAEGSGFDPGQPDRCFDAIVLDVDHSPRQLLNQRHADFYQPAGLRRVADRLSPGGVFALWSNDPPDEAFLAALGEVFARARAEVVSFPNPLQGGESSNTVYLAHRR
jgi:spermidine synthase